MHESSGLMLLALGEEKEKEFLWSDSFIECFMLDWTHGSSLHQTNTKTTSLIFSYKFGPQVDSCSNYLKQVKKGV